MRVVPRGGQHAVTTYESLARRGRFTLVRCRLETGRRNQIRAHMSAIGCPVAGDRKYGFRARAGEKFDRPLLHSWRLAFRHPLLDIEVAVEAPPPDPLLAPA
jgi:23S rRNA pseudouridine1911/1915/1917 synthase